MHGVILQELRAFADTFGPDVWKALLSDAGLQGRLYLPAGVYDDADVNALVNAAAKKTQKTPHEVLHSFGVFLAPRLLRGHARHIQPGWRTLETLVHVEDTMHRVVRAQNKDATPPALTIARVDDSSVAIDYRSPRRLCPLARGMVTGVAAFFGEAIVVSEPSCMLRGDGRCAIVATLS